MDESFQIIFAYSRVIKEKHLPFGHITEFVVGANQNDQTRLGEIRIGTIPRETRYFFYEGLRRRHQSANTKHPSKKARRLFVVTLVRHCFVSV
jgi:hypothetical protein